MPSPELKYCPILRENSGKVFFEDMNVAAGKNSLKFIKQKLRVVELSSRNFAHLLVNKLAIM